MQRQHIIPDPNLGQAEAVKNSRQNEESIKDAEKYQSSAKAKISLEGLGPKQTLQKERAGTSQSTCAAREQQQLPSKDKARASFLDSVCSLHTSQVVCFCSPSLLSEMLF